MQSRPTSHDAGAHQDLICRGLLLLGDGEFESGVGGQGRDDGLASGIKFGRRGAAFENRVQRRPGGVVVVRRGGDGGPLAAGPAAGIALRGGEPVGQQAAAPVAVVPDTGGDARDAAGEGGRERVGQQQRGAVAVRAEGLSGALGAHHALAAEAELVDEVGPGQDLLSAGAGEGADQRAGQPIAEQAQGGRGHHDVADPGGEDDQQAGGAGGHAALLGRITSRHR
jgi:hypothetical protein